MGGEHPGEREQAGEREHAVVDPVVARGRTGCVLDREHAEQNGHEAEGGSWTAHEAFGAKSHHDGSAGRAGRRSPGRGRLGSRSVTPETLGRRALNRATLARQLLLDRSDMAPLRRRRRTSSGSRRRSRSTRTSRSGRGSSGSGRRRSARLLTERAASCGSSSCAATIHLVTADDCLLLRPLIQPVLDRELARPPQTSRRRLRGVDLEPGAALRAATCSPSRARDRSSARRSPSASRTTIPRRSRTRAATARARAGAAARRLGADRAGDVDDRRGVARPPARRRAVARRRRAALPRRVRAGARSPTSPPGRG